MRYLSSVSNPLAHYWEEDLTGIWGVWYRLRSESRKTVGLLFGEFIFANVYLVWEIIAYHSLILFVSGRIDRLTRRISIDAFSKRAIDILGACFGLLISLPIWLMIPVLTKLSSRGPVLYSQTRVGLNRRRRDRRQIAVQGPDKRTSYDRRQIRAFGKPFSIFKFRTMCQDAEKTSGPVWASQNDSRITPVGRFLRKTRIDEIPQLINVLLGDMSLVGPRPERPFFVEKLDRVVENYRGRFYFKPGVTGLAQVEHKYDESVEDVSGKVKYDLNYIKNWNIFQDIRIMLKTVIVVLTARGM